MKNLKGVVLALLSALPLLAQNAAVSSHTNFGTNITGDITISEVRVPTDGVTTNTYYETLGFWGNKGNATGNGYGGIQESSDGRGNKVHIFSIWHALDNPNDTANFPYAVHLAYGMKAEFFGGEGVGLKTWNLTDDPNHPLYWVPDVWYTHVVRTWDVDNHTYYGFFVRDGAKGIWQHLSTIGVRESNIRISGRNDAFIEDWSGSGQNSREIHLRNNWRRDLTGKWNAAQTGDYSVNFWDLEPGKRSYNYRFNWDGGVRSDATGGYYYMTTGGAETSPTPPLNFPNKLSNSYSMTVNESAPQFPTARVADLFVEELTGKLALAWEMDSTTLPLFSYAIEIFDNAELSGTPLVSKSAVTPHARVDTLDISALDSENKKYYVAFKAIDIFDGAAATVEKSFGKGEVTPYINLLTPKEGDSYLHGDTVTINWKSNQSGNGSLTLINKDENGVEIATVTLDQSPFTWVIPDMIKVSEHYRVALSINGSISLSDTSNGTFTIAAPDSVHWLLDQRNLSVHSFTNEQNSSSDAAVNVLDGDPATMWHTNWSGTPTHPHEIVLKADKAYSFTGLLYLPRQGGGNGTIANYEIFVSDEGTNWGSAVKSGTFATTAGENRVTFPPKSGQYIKLVSLSEIGGQPFTSAAEINVLYDISQGTAITHSKLQRPTMNILVQGNRLLLSLPKDEQYTVTLYNTAGKQLLSKSLQGGMQTLQTTQGSGIYILGIEGGSLRHSSRVVLP